MREVFAKHKHEAAMGPKVMNPIWDLSEICFFQPTVNVLPWTASKRCSCFQLPSDQFCEYECNMVVGRSLEKSTVAQQPQVNGSPAKSESLRNVKHINKHRNKNQLIQIRKLLTGKYKVCIDFFLYEVHVYTQVINYYSDLSGIKVHTQEFSPPVA